MVVFREGKEGKRRRTPTGKKEESMSGRVEAKTLQEDLEFSLTEVNRKEKGPQI